MQFSCRRIHLDHRDVRIQVGADDIAHGLIAGRKIHLKLGGALDHVVVGHHMPGVVKDKARTKPAALVGGDLDRDHARVDPVEQVDKDVLVRDQCGAFGCSRDHRQFEVLNLGRDIQRGHLRQQGIPAKAAGCQPKYQ